MGDILQRFTLGTRTILVGSAIADLFIRHEKVRNSGPYRMHPNR
jgi:hypothetical protein